MARATAKKEENIFDLPDFSITKPSIFQVSIQGVDSLIFNKMPDLSISKTEKAAREKVDPIENERNTWREKLYVDDAGMVIMPGENLHECLKEGCKYWGARIAGEGKKSYTDLVSSAIICENLPFEVHMDDTERIIPFGKAVNGNPSRGKTSGSKVYKIRPLMRPWGGSFKIHVFDARLSVEVLKTIISYAGMFRGMGDWRPVYGRFNLIELVKI
jgi:hypothetical protein